MLPILSFVALFARELTTGHLLHLAFKMKKTLGKLQIHVEMSPFMSPNKIKKPILLIHGEEENYSGTLAMQLDRFFSALKGRVAPCRLVILPYESHGYDAAESIMHVLWETDRLLQKYCISASGVLEDLYAYKSNGGRAVNDSENKALSASSVCSGQECVDQEGFHSTPRSLLWFFVFVGVCTTALDSGNSQLLEDEKGPNRCSVQAMVTSIPAISGLEISS